MNAYLVHPEQYPFNEGRIVSNKGIDILPEQYDFHFRKNMLSIPIRLKDKRT
jgi:hypothetical protein